MVKRQEDKLEANTAIVYIKAVYVGSEEIEWIIST